MMDLEVDSEDDIPLSKIAKLSNENLMLNNMGNILKEMEDPFRPHFPKQFSFDQVPDPHTLEMNILIETEPTKPEVAGNEMPREQPENVSNFFIPVEYEWPQRSGDYFMLRGDLERYLEIRGEDKSLESVEARATSDEELTFLAKKGMVTSTSTSEFVLKAEDAVQFMSEKDSLKFRKYIECAHKREMKTMLQRQEAQRTDVIRGNVSRLLKRTLKEAARYNSQLNRERKESRRAYFDLQTQIIHLPQKKKLYDPERKSQISSYPLALLPGQYQEYFKKYTPEQLKTFPLNSVTSHPSPKKVVTSEGLIEDEKPARMKKDVHSSKKEVVPLMDSLQPDKDPFCGICMKGPEMNKRGLPEKLIHCSQCENSGHPSCLDMNRHLINVIKTYAWQCMECKVCTECLAPHDEEEMIFCDNCDRGYHSYCVGLKEIPKGRWVCIRCGKCASCLDLNPVPEGASGRWLNEYSKPSSAEEQPELLQVHCHGCSKLFRKGSFCPVCLKVYRSDDDHINPMVCCDECDRWIHTDCDGIDDHRYMELSKDQKSSYTCILCRGEKEERMSAFHKKNR